METKFYPMKQRPAHSEDDITFSKTVLLFEGKNSLYSDLGYFDYETEEWVVFGDDSMNLVCWCELPDPTDYINNNELTIVTHRGYRP